ncbi:MAG: trigger factor [Phycisphaerae bacterium]|nr:trigger factor [Phycisphaerae bacterium]
MAEEDVAGSQVDEESVAEDEEKEEDPKDALKKVIDVDVADAGALRKTLTITVPRDALQQELDKDYKELISEAIVPGFRRGRAPRRLIEKRFGSEVGEQVQARVVSNAYMAAIEKEDIHVLGDPLVWVSVKDKKAKEEEGKEQLLDMPAALRHMELPDEGEMVFRCEVEVKPEFELPELEGVPVERPKLEISEEDVTVQIDRWRALRGHWAPVWDGAVEADDLLICDMRMRVDGEEVKTLDNVQLAARAQVLEGVTLDDLGEQMEGAKVGDTRRFEGRLPDDYEVEGLRGKQAEFELTLNDIKRQELPPLDAEYLSALGFDSEQEYRTWVKEQMDGRLEQELRQGMRGQVRKHLLDNTELDLPEGVSMRQTERVARRRMVELQRRGVPEAEIEKHADELRTGAREQAVVELKLHFILERIAEKLDIEVTEEDINGQIAAMAQAYNRRFDRVRDELARNNGIESLYLDIRDEKCIDKILETANITEARVEKKRAPRKKKTTAKSSEAEKKQAGSEAAATKPQRKPPPKK